MSYTPKNNRDGIRNSFLMPNEIFALGLSGGAILVYTYLRYCENRETYQCYPSYKTIGKALKIKSKGTVAKYVRELEDKCLIYTEPTEVILKDGKKRNGNLKYTIRPIQDAIEHYHYEQMKNVNEVAARAKAQKMLDDYNRKHPKATA